ncbi:MAG: flavocytochrome c [Sutterellaceae bacterium]|nr:flavocytochrome c [Sutterellaceae bacterium]MDY2868818.1 flavocytochrome c [Mesosutterella sp.]
MEGESNCVSGQPPPALPEETVDIVVVGSGFAGIAAAIEALGAGASVLVIEKMPEPGGNSVIDSGQLAVVGSPQQEARRIHDSADLLAEDILVNGEHLNDPLKVRYIAEHSHEVYEWVTLLGVRWASGVAAAGGHSIPRILFTESGSGREIHQALMRKFELLGGKVRTNCFVERILRRGNGSGRVEGLIVREGYRFPDASSGSPKRILVRRAVILCHGGFAADVAYRQKMDSHLTPDLGTTNQPGATGELWRETVRAGCEVLQAGWVQSTPWNNPKEKGQGIGWLFSEYAPPLYGLWIDSDGNRFVDETANRKVRTEAIFEEHRRGRRVFCVATEGCGKLLDSIYENYLETVLRRGIVQRFESLGELDEELGIRQGGAEDAVKALNECIRARKDDPFGRSLRRMKPLKGRRWLAAEMTPKVHHCMGGVMTTLSGEVLDARTQLPMGGLYAAGECAGGVHGACRITACAILDCIAMGRLAGRNAAKGGA